MQQVLANARLIFLVFAAVVAYILLWALCALLVPPGPVYGLHGLFILSVAAVTALLVRRTARPRVALLSIAAILGLFWLEAAFPITPPMTATLNSPPPAHLYRVDDTTERPTYALAMTLATLAGLALCWPRRTPITSK